MATFKEQIEAMAGDSAGTLAEQYLDDGIKDIIRRLGVLDVSLLHNFSKISDNIVADTGYSIATNDRILDVSRYDGTDSHTARMVSANDRFRAVKTDSLYLVTKYGPVYYKLNSTLHVLPVPTSSEPANVSFVTYGNVTSWDTGSSGVDFFPDEFYPLLIKYASAQVFLEKLQSYSGLPSDLTSPSLPTSPVFTYEDVAGLTIVAEAITTLPSPPSYTQPVLTLGDVPTIIDLDVTISIPDSPVTPVFTNPDASSIFNPTGSGPSYSAPEITSTAGTDLLDIIGGTIDDDTDQIDFSKWWDIASDMIESEEDIELATAQIQKISTYLQAYAQEMQNKLNIFNEENVEYQAELQQAVQEIQSVLQKEGQEYTAILQKYSSDVQQYQAEVNTVVQEYTQNYQKDLQLWQSERQTDLQKYTADMQNELNVYNKELAEYGTEVQKVMQNAQMEQQAIIAEATQDQAASMQNSLQGLQKAVQEYQSELGRHTSDLGAKVQEFSTKLQKANSEYQWMLGRYQLMQAEYEKGFAPNYASCSI